MNAQLGYGEKQPLLVPLKRPSRPQNPREILIVLLVRPTIHLFPALTDCGEDVLHHQRPSSHITAALISLARAVNQLGLPPSALQQKPTLPLTIRIFIEAVVQSTSLEDLQWGSSAAQLLWDLIFLETISNEAGVGSSIAQVIESLKAKVRPFSWP